MPLTPEQAQKLTNLQQRVLANIAAGKSAHADITEEEVRESLDILRQDRGRALAAGEAKKPRAKKEAKPKASATGSIDDILASKFKGMSFD